jgi:Ras-related protein Rab-6A
MTEEDIQHFKIIFLGDQFVGKSSILNRFYQDKFEPDYQATIGLDFHSKNVNINNSVVRLLLYDTAGQEKFKSLIPMYIRDANIIIVVYDISNKESFTHTEHWVNETKDLKREDAIFVLVGNKIDLEDKRAVESREAEEFANEKGFLFYEVSAKTGENVEDLFEKKIFPEMGRKYNIGDEEEEGEGGEVAQNRNDGGIKLGNNNQAPKKKGGCCGGGKNKKTAPQVESQGNEGNEGTEGDGGTKESQGEE